MKIFIDPPNSMILFDLVERFGHDNYGNLVFVNFIENEI